jgi:hypothetical protein
MDKLDDLFFFSPVLWLLATTCRRPQRNIVLKQISGRRNEIFRTKMRLARMISKVYRLGATIQVPVRAAFK